MWGSEIFQRSGLVTVLVVFLTTFEVPRVILLAPFAVPFTIPLVAPATARGAAHPEISSPLPINTKKISRPDNFVTELLPHRLWPEWTEPVSPIP